MKSKQFAVLVIVAFIGCIGQVFANDVQNKVNGEEMKPATDIRKKFERTQQGAGRHNQKVAELIRTRILPEKEYADQLEKARTEIQKMDLDELREKLASLQAANICLINAMGNLLYAREKKQQALDRP